MENQLQVFNDPLNSIPEEPVVFEHIEIESSFKADLILIKIDEFQEQISEIIDLYEKEAAYLKEWTEERVKKLTQNMDFYKHNLEIWMLQKEKRSISLPHGKAYFRKQPFKVEVINEDKLIDNGFKRITTSVDKKKLLEHFKSSGEIVDGCDIVKPDEKFYVKTNSQYKGNSNGSH